MASNGSSAGDYAQIILSQSVYVVEGVATLYANALILAAIALHPWLRRKELAAVAALALVDALYGFGRVAAGYDRLSLIARGATGSMARARDCFTVGIATLAIGSQASSVMMLMLSIDRLFAVARYGAYMSYGRSYVLKMLSIPAVFSLCSLAFILYAPYNLVSEEYQYPAFCFGLWAFPQWYSLVVYGVIIGGGYGSIIIYLFVYIAYRKTSAVGGDDAKKRQNRLTTTLGIVNLATFLLICIPMTAVFVLGVIQDQIDPSLYGIVTITLFMLSGLNPLVNVFIYLRNQEMSTAIRAVMRFRRANKVAPAPPPSVRQQAVK